MYDVSGLSLVSSPWELVRAADYNRACEAREIVVDVSAEDRGKLKCLLHFDKRPNGDRGRRLTSDYPPLLLKAGGMRQPSRRRSL